MKKEYSIEELRVISKCRAAERNLIISTMLAVASGLYVISYSLTLWLALKGRLDFTSEVMVGSLLYGGAACYLGCYLVVIRPRARATFLKLRDQSDEINCIHRDSIPNK